MRNNVWRLGMGETHEAKRDGIAQGVPAEPSGVAVGVTGIGLALRAARGPVRPVAGCVARLHRLSPRAIDKQAARRELGRSDEKKPRAAERSRGAARSARLNLLLEHFGTDHGF